MQLVHFNEIYDNVSAAVNETGGLAVLAVFVEVLLLLLSAHIAFMQSTDAAYCYKRHVVAWSVCVCLLHTMVSPA